MRTLHLFLTIALSLSTTAYDDSRLQRRLIVPVNGLGISNRDLSVFPRSNTSDSYSLDNIKRALDDHRLVRRVSSGIVKLTMNMGRPTGTVSFSGESVAIVLFDTGSSITWAKLSAIPSSTSITFATMGGLFKLQGYKAKGTVKLRKGLTSQMEFAKVSGKTPNNYAGGIALDRSRISWSNSLVNHIPPHFAFYSLGPNHIEFDFGGFDTQHYHNIEWYHVSPHDKKWTIDDAHIKIDGEASQVEGISTIINTGVRYIYGSANEVAKVYQKLEGRHLDGFWTLPCDKPPVVSFSWGKTDFPIHDYLVDGKSSEVGGRKYCRGAIRPHRRVPDNQFVLGITFVYGKYAAFDGVHNVMGFTLIQHPASQQ
ncbi:hypothetical protein APHAL10511_005294 [Amanita phalloides]|nr:hypothetical protein APHAL10511_005294 [Amanita phalloides]